MLNIKVVFSQEGKFSRVWLLFSFLILLALILILTTHPFSKLKSPNLTSSNEIEHLTEVPETSTSAEKVYDESKYVENYFENVVIHACEFQNVPGDTYETIGQLEYGDIIYTFGNYEEWTRFIKNSSEDEFWLKSENLLATQKHVDYNLGVIIANEVLVGSVTLKRGNLVQILIEDPDRTCVTIRKIDIPAGITGWISNLDYTLPAPNIYFNQAYIKHGTTIYKEPSINAELVDYTPQGGLDVFVFIESEKEEWTQVASFGPIEGWVKSKEIFIPTSTTEGNSKVYHSEDGWEIIYPASWSNIKKNFIQEESTGKTIEFYTENCNQEELVKWIESEIKRKLDATEASNTLGRALQVERIGDLLVYTYTIISRIESSETELANTIFFDGKKRYEFRAAIPTISELEYSEVVKSFKILQ